MAEFQTLLPHVRWHKGMLLNVQHFQQMNFRIDDNMRMCAFIDNTYNWGVLNLSINEDFLAEGNFVVDEICVIFQNGKTVSNFINNTFQPISIPVKEDLESKENLTTKIYVAILKNHSHKDAYHNIEAKDVEDVFNPSQSINIPQVMERIVLLDESKMNAEYIGFPIAELALVNGKITITDYIPPHFKVYKDSTLGTLMLNLCKQLRQKAKTLENSFLSSDLATRANLLHRIPNTIMMLTSFLPYLESLVHAESSHPLDVYLALTQIAGNISTLNESDMLPPNLEPYEHLNIKKSFAYLIQYAKETSAALKDEYKVKFIRHENGYFTLDISIDNPNDPIIIALVPNEHHTTDELIKWISGAFITSEDNMEKIKLDRSIGSKRKRITSYAPLKLIASGGEILISIDLDVPGNKLIISGVSEAENDSTIPDYIIHYSPSLLTAPDDDTDSEATDETEEKPDKKTDDKNNKGDETDNDENVEDNK